MNAPSNPVLDVLETLRSHRSFESNVVDFRTIPARAAVHAPMPAGLHPELVAAFAARGIDRLWSHQAEAVEHVLARRNVVVVTPTASGKTLCYNLPVLDGLMRNPESRALYLFPTKALSHDQYASLHEICGGLGREFKVFTYDGDTPVSARGAIRSAGQIVVTNPDMLHTGILPHHTRWTKLFENLRVVVIDEMHQYRGVFGSHMANVVRRLRRLCRHYGADPVFVCCSATIANPKELAETLVEAPFESVEKSGAPSGERIVVFYNPPVVNKELGIRASSVKQATRIAMRFLERDVQTIVFARSRNRVEVVTNYLKREMKKLGRDPERVRGYRGGYLPLLRREIEAGVRDGRVLGVVSTNALELGIDIGSLQVSILAGYPGTIASTWQQWGRAGRQTQTAAVVLVGASAPVDQYFMTNPDAFFGSSPETAILNPDNIAILASHLKCALYELPMRDDERFGAHPPAALLDHFESEGIARRAGGRTFWSAEAYPAEEVSLRTATPQNFIVHDTTDANRVLAEVDFDSAQEMIHPQAIYMHQGATYHVDQLDWDRRRAYVRRIASDYYTDAIAKSDLFVTHVDLSEEIATTDPGARASGEGARASRPPEPEERANEMSAHPPSPASPWLSRNFGAVKVTTTVPKFKKIKFETHESVGYGEIALPEIELQTEAAWWTFREELAEEYAARGLDFGGALEGLAWIVKTVASIAIMSDPRDIGTVPMVRSPLDCRPTLFLHDRVPGGIGLARRAYGMDRRIFRAALDLARGCKCPAGCPACVGPDIKLGAKAKRSVVVLLEEMLG